MTQGIKNDIAIIGMGCTKFGELWDKSGADLVVDAFQEALGDAGIEKKDVKAAWFATCFDEFGYGKSALPLPKILKLPFIPVSRVENFCASGTDAFRNACYAVASGACDIALALGAEKLKDTGYGGLPDLGTLMGTENRIILPNITGPGGFAMMATAYFNRYGIPPEEGKKLLARVSWKSHKNGALNPKAHLRREVSIEQIMQAPLIAWPLGLFDCCGVSDGAACAIICKANIANNFRKDPIYVKALQISATSMEEMAYQGWDGAHVEPTYRAGIEAYKEAGVTNPRKEISMFEVHDCFSITEFTAYEDLQISPRGEAGKDVEAGFFDLDGTIPCQTDGGLKCFGHPIGASGLRMLYEMYKQLQGKAGDRQVKNPKLGLTHNMGGFPFMGVASVAIVGNEL
ncbi:MAG TPA: acetyl-CoA acetyltransferase [Syntrophales bacterium]